MIPVADSSPVLIGNKVESILPYLISNEFVVDAKQDGEVVEIKDDYCVARYNDGTYYSIDIGSRIKKNASAGFFIDNKLTCNLKVGDKFKKGDILAYSDKAFTPNRDGKGASMNLGVLTKIAIVSNWDVYEDSAPITKKLAERLATDMVWEKAVSLNPGTYIEKMVKIGDKIKTGESLMLFEEVDNADFAAVLKQIREENQEELIESTKSTITSKYTGEIADIKIYSTVPVEEMDESLAKIVSDYYKKVEKRNNVLEKYKNPGDCNYYKSGQIISEESKVMKPSKSGKIKGEYAENSVVIVFYVKYRDVAAKGDKVCAQFALKGVCSHVIEEGLEPYSEYRPDEEISALVAPLAVSARKVPSVFKMMFGNKLLIELKRHLKEMYLNN